MKRIITAVDFFISECKINFYSIFYILFRNLLPQLSYAPCLCKYYLRVVSLSPILGVCFSLKIFEIGYQIMILWMFEYFSMVEGA